MMLLTVVLLPLVGALLNGILIRPKKPLFAGLIATLAIVSSFGLSLFTIIQKSELMTGASFVEPLFTWIETGTYKFQLGFELTAVSSIMLLVVTGIGSLIHIYSIAYMDHEKSPWRFFAYLNLFVCSMLMLVLSTDLIGVFLGWEGVGLCSYLLIGFWYTSESNAKAGMKAFVTNRIGDLGFLLSLFLILAYVGTTDIRGFLNLLNGGFVDLRTSLPVWVLPTIALGIFWASTGKSAQLPLYVWLPDAMAGPTPVSALIHAATMVTSGIVLITRLWPLFATQPMVLDVIFWTGLATAWLAALIAFSQKDIKKVLAYSTVSQLGFMFVALGAGSPAAALFHVVTHACFKALLFLGAGSVIHGMHEKQDLFEMGGLKKKMKQTHGCVLVATLAIIGFPLSSGFFSKEMILAKVFEKSALGYVLLLSAALMTAFYMLRMYTLAFHGKARSKEAEHAHESSLLMTVPLMVLAVLSLTVGFLEMPPIFANVHKFQNWVEMSWYGFTPEIEAHSLSHLTEWILVLITSSSTLAVSWFAFKRYEKGPQKALLPESLVQLSENKFYVDEIYEKLVLDPLSWLAKTLTRGVDVLGINGALHFLRDSLRFSGQIFSLAHSGSLQSYAWFIAVMSGLFVFLTWAMFLKGV